MRAPPIVVLHVLPKYSLEMTMAEDEDPVEAFSPNRPHPTFGEGIGSRRSDRRFDDSDTLGAEYLVEGGGELGVAIPNQEPDGSTEAREVAHQVACHLSDEGSSRMVGDSQDVDPSRRQFDDEKNVQLFERHGVNGEEVRGEHAVCLRAEELRPGRSAPRRRSETMSAQDPTDRTGSYTDTKLSQLALDTDASPASVLPTETNDEGNEFIAYRRTTRASLCSPSPPLALAGFSMPSEQRVGGNHEGPPPISREESAECSEDRSIGWTVPDTSVMLSVQNTHLMAEHHDFDVLVGLGSNGAPDEAEETAQTHVKESEGHGG